MLQHSWKRRVRREGIVVAFHEVSKESYASGGELMVDEEK
jgi:phenylpyruvate tautomerase PptA (4-oxalocrotonate tautomerase family)